MKDGFYGGIYMAIPLEALSFTALNLHTANRSTKSLCGIGILVVENGKTLFANYILVKPKTSSFSYEQYGYFKEQDVLIAPTLKEVWPNLLPYIENRNLVFYDIGKSIQILSDSLGMFKIPMPNFNAVDICDMFYENHYGYSYAALAHDVGYSENFQKGNVYDNLNLYKAVIEYGAKRGSRVLRKEFGIKEVQVKQSPVINETVITENNGCVGCFGCLIPALCMLFIIILILI